jgi:hypothetical protein
LLGFFGPYSGGKHQFMVFNNHRLAIPSNDEYSVSQQKMMLREIQLIIEKTITNADWEAL